MSSTYFFVMYMNIFLCQCLRIQINQHLRYDVAKLLNMDYKDETQKKLVDKICAKLDSDMDWDEDDQFEKCYKDWGFKRYKLDKKLLSRTEDTESFHETIASSSSKDGKGALKSALEDKPDGIAIKIQNPTHVDLMTLTKTTKSAADAVSALVSQLKKLLPSLQMVSSTEGF